MDHNEAGQRWNENASTNRLIEAVDVHRGSLAEYARIPITFEVNAILDVDVDESNSEGFRLTKHPLTTPYVKDYDAMEKPEDWVRRFDTSKWGLLIARIGTNHVGGATIAYDTPGLDMLDGRPDMAILWDIRVLPAHRRRGIGAALFGAAEAWALARGCRQLKVETQNINVAACTFYAQNGCVLRAAHRGVYVECPDEVQLLWYKDLAQQTVAGQRRNGADVPG